MSNELDLTASFVNVLNPTPFGIYDSNTAFRTDANAMVKLVYNKLGGNVLQVELTNKDVYTCLEQAVLEYSSIMNTYQAKSVLANILGSQTGSLQGSQQQLPRMDMSLAKRLAGGFSSEAMVGGTRTLYSASIDVSIGVQHYNLNSMLSSSGQVLTGQRAEIRDIFHFSPAASYRFFDTTSAINYLHNQFNFESFTPETVFYLLPVWEDVLRAQQLETSFNIRRSNYSFNLVNNNLTIYPVPTIANRLHFTYYLQGDSSVYDTSDPFTNGVSNLSNVPFGNIDYSNINSMGKTWIYRYALALSQETLGHIRSKVASVPIPNGDLVLNGPQLLADAVTEKANLRLELKDWLESMTYDKLLAKQQEEADNLQRTLAKVPLAIYVG